MDDLSDFFQLYAPSKLGNVAAIRAKYAGKETQLFAFLRTKYAAEIAALDFCAPQFDAAKALQHAHLRPPCVGAQLYDNISRCRSLLPPSSEDYAAPRVRSARPAPAARRKAAPAPQQRPGGAPKGIVELLAHYAAEKGGGEEGAGPLSLLQRCLRSGARVRVVIRRIDGVRGHCDGKLKAFDRHFNMILLDADETFDRVERSLRASDEREQAPRRLRGDGGGGGRSSGSSRRRGGGGGGTIVKHLSGDRVVRRVQRHIGQVFVRGDNVVLVHALPQREARSRSRSRARPRY